MTDHARDDRAREIDTAALRARLSAVAHGSDRPYAASVAKDAFGALSILLDEIDRLRAENERLRNKLAECEGILSHLPDQPPHSGRLRSTIPNRHIPIRPLEDEK